MRSALLSLMLPVLAAAQSAPGVLTFEKLHHDFGKVHGIAPVSYKFKATNTGSGLLNISRLNPSCGCTSTVVGQWTLAPGESTFVEVTFNPTGFRGLTRKSLQVISNDPANPNQTLTFEAEVIREIMPATESLYFTEVDRRTPRKGSVRLASGNGRPVQVTGVSSPGAPYLALAVRQDGLDAIVDVTFDGRQAPAGRTQGAEAVVVRTASAQVPVVNLTVQWDLRATVVAEPVRVAWVEAAGRELRAKISLRQVDNKPFRVTATKTSNPLLKVEGAGRAAAASQELTVVLAASAKPGMYTEKVLLTLDDPAQPELELRVSAALR